MQRCPTGQICGTGVPPVDYYYHTDDLYNVMAVTDGNGTVVERYEYGDYGTPLIMDAAGTVLASSTIGNPYLFTGRRYDPETGWYHYRTRYLDPAAGRFTTRDVIGIWGDMAEFGNGYPYVRSNPLSWLDSLGLAPPTTQPSHDDEIQKIIDEQLRDIRNDLAKQWGVEKAKEVVEFIAEVKHAAEIGKSLTVALSGISDVYEFSNAFNTATGYFNKSATAFVRWKFLQALNADYDDFRVDERGLGNKTFYGGKTCGTCNFFCLCGPGGNDRPFIVCSGGFSKCSGPGDFTNPRQNKCTAFCNKKRKQQKEKEKEKEEESCK